MRARPSDTCSPTSWTATRTSSRSLCIPGTRGGVWWALIDTAAAWAAQQHLAALTLTTYAHVPWNAPYYERLGFEVLDEHELTEGLRRVREHEAARGLAAWPRVTMRRRLRSRPGGRPAPATRDGTAGGCAQR